MLALKMCDYFTLIVSQLNCGKKCPEWTHSEEKNSLCALYTLI